MSGEHRRGWILPVIVVAAADVATGRIDFAPAKG